MKNTLRYIIAVASLLLVTFTSTAQIYIEGSTGTATASGAPSVFGHLYRTNFTGGLNLSASATWLRLSNYSGNSVLSNTTVSLTDGTITVGQDGDYLVVGSATIKDNSVLKGRLGLGLGTNEAISHAITTSLDDAAGAGNEQSLVVGPFILKLDATTRVSLMVTSSATTSYILPQYYLNVIKIAGVTVGGVTVAGANTEVQYNSGGLLGASSKFTFNSGSARLRVSEVGVGTNDIFPSRINGTGLLNLDVNGSATWTINESGDFLWSSFPTGRGLMRAKTNEAYEFRLLGATADARLQAASATPTNFTITLPPTNGLSGQVWTANGSGGSYWKDDATGAGGSGGTNFPPVINLLGGTNIAVGSGVEQSLTLTTNATLNLNFQGTPLNGEVIEVAVSNYSANAIFVTNRRDGVITAFYQPQLGSNNSVLTLPGNSITYMRFVFHTNFNNGSFRQELRTLSQVEAALAVDSANNLALTTNAGANVITMIVTNTTGSGHLVRSNGATMNNLTALGLNASAATVTNGVTHMPSNALPYIVGVANSNAVQVTELKGLIEAAYASVIFLDASLARNLTVSNRVSGNLTLVLTNSAQGHEFNIVALGEAAGGAARTLTVIPHLGQLVANLDVFGTALATTYSATLTNGNAIEFSSRVVKQNGTNVHNIISRQYAF